MNSVPYRCSGDKCVLSPQFTVTVLAVETGKAHRDRRRFRVKLGHYCEKCLKARVYQFKGREFLPAKSGA